MIGLKLQLNNGESVTANYRQIRASRLLEGVVPADGDEESLSDMCLPLDISSEDWKLYCDFVSAVADVELQTKQKFVPNFNFADDYLKELPEEVILQLKRVGRYLDCHSIEETIKYFIGGMYSHYTIKEFLPLVGIKDESDPTYQRVRKEARKTANNALVQKLKELVPELKDFPVTFDL